MWILFSSIGFLSLLSLSLSISLSLSLWLLCVLLLLVLLLWKMLCLVSTFAVWEDSDWDGGDWDGEIHLPHMKGQALLFFVRERERERERELSKPPMLNASAQASITGHYGWLSRAPSNGVSPDRLQDVHCRGGTGARQWRKWGAFLGGKKKNAIDT